MKVTVAYRPDIRVSAEEFNASRVTVLADGSLRIHEALSTHTIAAGFWVECHEEEAS